MGKSSVMPDANLFQPRFRITMPSAKSGENKRNPKSFPIILNWEVLESTAVSRGRMSTQLALGHLG